MDRLLCYNDNVEVVRYAPPVDNLWRKLLRAPWDGVHHLLGPFYHAGARWIARHLYQLTVSGFEKMPRTGPVVIISNHVSYVDGMIIHSCMPRNDIRYVIDAHIYNTPGVHYFMKLARAIPILPTRESVVAAMDEISRALKAGDAVCIFPEGQLTYTGSLGRVRSGIESIIRRDPVPVYPIIIQGMWGSVFSRKYLKSRLRWLPRHWKRRKVVVKCGDPIPPEKVKINYLQQLMLQMKYK